MKTTTVALIFVCLASGCSGSDLDSDFLGSNDNPATSTDNEVNLTTTIESALVRFQIPDTWTATEDVIDGHDSSWNDVEDPDVDTWNIRRNTNEEVELALAEEFGLVEKLPLWDPSGIMESDEIDALNADGGTGLGVIQIVVGRPPNIEPVPEPVPAPWKTTEEVKTYLDEWHSSENLEPVELAGFAGFTYSGRFFVESTTYQLVYPEDQRLYITFNPSNSDHRAEMDAIVASIQQPE